MIATYLRWQNKEEEGRGEDIRREVDAGSIGGWGGLLDRGRKRRAVIFKPPLPSLNASFLPSSPLLLGSAGRGEGRTNLVLMLALSGEEGWRRWLGGGVGFGRGGAAREDSKHCLCRTFKINPLATGLVSLPSTLP